LTLLAAQSPDGRPIAVLANYSMHYFGAPAISADYYGLFAEKLGPLSERGVEARCRHHKQGTSGISIGWTTASRRRQSLTPGRRTGADSQCLYKTIAFAIGLAMRQKTQGYCQPTLKRLAWARPRR
jgi:hypothetical protein